MPTVVALEAVSVLLAVVEGVVIDPDRWDPPWMQWLVGVALLLAILAFLWWAFLVIRVQDLLRDESAARRRR